MGICCSKKMPNFSSPSPKSDPPIQPNPNPNPQIDKTPVEKTEIKEKLIINHRKSNETNLKPNEETPNPDQKPKSLATNGIGDSNLESGNSNLINSGATVVRTSSCTRDEVDAILIQCGRLSRSSSAVQTPVTSRKRSHDFDKETENADVATTRESRGQSRPSPRRRRTPSREREREKDQNQQIQRNSSGRRISRSPGKRSESPIATCHNPSGGAARPGKMVSVPATISSLAMDKSNNGERVVSKRNAMASPHRSRSPAARPNYRVSNEINQNVLLSRSNSRRAEHSPNRRNPLGEIDQNAVNNSEMQKQGVDNAKNSRTKTKEPPNQTEDKTKAAPQQQMTNKLEAVSGPEPINSQPITRTRSRRLSRDLDNLEPQNLSPPPSSYTSLLLKDIQSFHNQTPNINSIPCLSKTCSILEQIADLNSNNKEKHDKRLLEDKEPTLVEIENKILMEPSFQKYVTVKRGNAEREEEREESSGSNSFVGGPQNWISSSLWETNSTDSTNCWESSSRSNLSNTKENDRKKKEIDSQKTGIGNRRADFSRGLHSRSAITAATI